MDVMLYFMSMVLLQTVLFAELGLLFLRVLGRRRAKHYCELGKSCISLQCFFIWISRIIGYLFITFAASVLSIGILQVLAVIAR